MTLTMAAHHERTPGKPWERPEKETRLRAGPREGGGGGPLGGAGRGSALVTGLRARHLEGLSSSNP